VRGRSRPIAVPASLAAVTAALVWATTQYGDYPFELGPAVRLLESGHLHQALASAPVYGGSLVPRLPAILLAHAAGGGAMAVYRAGAFACLLGVVVLATVLDRRMVEDGRSGAQRLALAATCLIPLVLLRCLSLGHPEEALGGALCAGAVLLALRDRHAAAGLALGAAIAVKPWAVLAVGPAVCAGTGGWRAGARILLWAGVAGGAILLPFALADGSHLVATQRGAASAAGSFEPQQLFWPLHHARSHVAGGIIFHGAVGPGWVQRVSHPLIVASAVPLTAVFLLRRRRSATSGADALALLALLLVLRCVLDPWNQPYYAVPAILALAGWEVVALRRAPVWAPATAAVTWLAFHGARLAHADLRFATVVLWALTLAVVLSGRVWGARSEAGRLSLFGRRGQPRSSATAARSAA
jgi:hypothetical protein